MMRIAFFGTPDFAVSALRALLEAGHTMTCVYTQPPRPAGRGQRQRLSPVHALAMQHGLQIETPTSLKDSQVQERLTALSLDAAVVVAYGLILPKPILDAPRLGCLNIHASLLPRWRGAAPIQRAILTGDAETGITIMRMDEGLDTGPTLLSEAVPIGADTTAAELHDILSDLGGRLICAALARLEAGTLTANPQPEEGATYAAKLTRDEGQLDWSEPATALARKVRAFAPWPGAWFAHRRHRFKVLEVATAEASGPPGAVLDDALTVACGTGALRLLQLQREGKAPMSAAALLRGYPLPRGVILGAL